MVVFPGCSIAAAERMSAKARGQYQEPDRNLDEAILFWKSALVVLGEANANDELDVVLLRADIVVRYAAKGAGRCARAARVLRGR